MINAVNIGNRIKTLRKQKHVSQERMAEDLGMYQADISNLERAMGGSGIADLFKLDMIADYFGITLVQLLNGFEEAPAVPDSENKKSEEHEVKDYTITDARSGFAGDYYASELKLTAPDKSVVYVSFSECGDEPRFYRSEESIYDGLLADRGEPAHEKELNRWCVLSGEDYIDIFRKADPKWVPVLRYLIYIATEDEDEVQRFADDTVGKMFGEIEVPIPSREPEELFDVNYSDLSVVYRYRLMVEANIGNPSVYSDLDDTAKKEKAILEKLKAACASEEAYKVWRKDLIDAGIREVKEKQKIVACTYIFAGMGQYKEIMPEEMVPSFKRWIDCSGSAFFGECRPATNREIRTYVSQHIADDLL